LWENRLHFEAVSDMAAAPQGFLSLGLKILGPAFAFARPTLGKWWRRRQIPAASPTKISILVAKLGGDTAADSHHHSIREAIKSAMPGAIERGGPRLAAAAAAHKRQQAASEQAGPIPLFSSTLCAYIQPAGASRLWR
jgi:hypothetical protein